MKSKSTKKTDGAKAETQTETTVDPKALGIDISKLTVAQIKELLKAKRAETKGSEFAESRATKVAKSMTYLADCEEWALKAQHKLDEALERQTKAQAHLDDLKSKYGTTVKEEDVAAAVNEIRRERQVALAKSKK